MDGTSIDTIEEAVLVLLIAALVLAVVAGAAWIHLGR